MTFDDAIERIKRDGQLRWTVSHVSDVVLWLNQESTTDDCIRVMRHCGVLPSAGFIYSGGTGDRDLDDQLKAICENGFGLNLAQSELPYLQNLFEGLGQHKHDHQTVGQFCGYCAAMTQIGEMLASIQKQHDDRLAKGEGVYESDFWLGYAAGRTASEFFHRLEVEASVIREKKHSDGRDLARRTIRDEAWENARPILAIMKGYLARNRGASEQAAGAFAKSKGLGTSAKSNSAMYGRWLKKDDYKWFFNEI